jgi:hypothetical protein
MTALFLTAGTQVAITLKKQTHRKGAKNKKCLVVFNKEFLCVLCVSAVKAVFMIGYRVSPEKQDVVSDA